MSKNNFSDDNLHANLWFRMVFFCLIELSKMYQIECGCVFDCVYYFLIYLSMAVYVSVLYYFPMTIVNTIRNVKNFPTFWFPVLVL